MSSINELMQKFAAHNGEATVAESAARLFLGREQRAKTKRTPALKVRPKVSPATTVKEILARRAPEMGVVKAVYVFTYAQREKFLAPFRGQERKCARSAINWTRRPAARQPITAWVFEAYGNMFRASRVDDQRFKIEVTSSRPIREWGDVAHKAA